jgi:predicted transcriptional regulator
MSNSVTQAISFRIRAEKVRALERLAKATDRPRSWHIEQALDSYLDLQAWQVAQIEKSMAEMDAGQGIPHQEVKKELLNWGKGNRAKRAK